VTTITAATEVKTVDELVTDINASSDLAGKVRASNDNNKLRIENLSTQELTIDGISSANSIDGTSTAAATILGNSVRAGLADQFNELRDQLDKLSDDASFNGINLLRGDNLKITFNETGTSSIDIQSDDGATINSANLGLETTLEAEDLDSDDTIDTYLAQIKVATNSVRAQSSAFGSNLSIVENRQEFTKNMINTLQMGAGNLTLADTNEEAANLLALQTRQSLSSSALSMASQADQSVLQLLR
jgi:flagellin